MKRLVVAPVAVALVFLALLAVTYWVYMRVPRGFIPDEDQGYLFVLINAPDGASLDYTTKVADRVSELLRAEIASTVAKEEEVEEEMRHLFTTLCG